MSEAALQIAEERRKVKGKAERERYTQLNAEFQRAARRDKKTFLKEQCKEIKETIAWERLEISSKKIGDIKGAFHARMGMITNRNSSRPNRLEEVKKRWQEYTELYKKSLNNLDNHNGVVIHLEHPGVTSTGT